MGNLFYLIYGKHPSVEDYIQYNEKHFELEKYITKLTPEIYRFIRDELMRRNSNEESLLLNHDLADCTVWKVERKIIFYMWLSLILEIS